MPYTTALIPLSVVYARKLSERKLSRTGKDIKGISRGIIEIFPRTFPRRRKESTTNFRILRMVAEFRKGRLAKRSLQLYPDVKRVKCTHVQALRLCTGRTAHRGSRGIALPFHDHGTRSGWGVSVTTRPLFTPGKDTVPIVQESGWAPGPVWIGAKKSRPYRDSIPGPSSL